MRQVCAKANVELREFNGERDPAPGAEILTGPFTCRLPGVGSAVVIAARVYWPATKAL